VLVARQEKVDDAVVDLVYQAVDIAMRRDQMSGPGCSGHLGLPARPNGSRKSGFHEIQNAQRGLAVRVDPVT